MQLYRQVQAMALEIVSVKPEEDGGASLTLRAPLPPVRVEAEYVAQHRPVAGGYLVVCEDGYKSYLPAEAIESAKRS